MKRIIIYQNEPLWIIETILLWFSIVLLTFISIILIIYDVVVGFPHSKFSPSYSIGFSIIYLLLAIFAIPIGHSMLSYNIHLDKNSIWMKGDFLLTKKWRIQYPVRVNLKDIKHISIVIMKKNSKNRYVYNEHDLKYINRRFIVITTKDNKTNRFHVTHHTESHLKKTIEIILRYILQSGNTVYDGKTSSEILFGPGYNPLDSSPE